MSNFVLFTSNASIFARSNQEKIFLVGKNKNSFKITDDGNCDLIGKNILSVPFKRKGRRNPEGVISVFSDLESEKKRFVENVLNTDRALGYDVHTNFERDGKIIIVEFQDKDKSSVPYMLTIREKRGLMDDGIPPQYESDCDFSCVRFVFPKQVIVGRPEYTSRAESLFHLEVFLFHSDDKERILSSGFLDSIHTIS